MNGALDDQRHCVECGKPIVHRRMTALYCSGKCREIHNARKRRQTRLDMKNAAQPAHIAAPGRTQDTEQ